MENVHIISLLLTWVSYEEYRGIVRYHIPISFFSSKLDCKSAWITSTVVRAGLATNGRETNGDRTRLALLREKVGHAEVGNGVRTLEKPVSATALGMDYALGNTLVVKMRQEIDEMEVLKQKRSVVARSLGLVRMSLRSSITITLSQHDCGISMAMPLTW